MQRLNLRAIAALILAIVAVSGTSQAALTYDISGTWPGTTATDASNAMAAIVADYNSYGNFGNFNFDVAYVSGVPTAQSNFMSQIQVGGSATDALLRRVLQHETNHVFGSGTTSNWTNEWTPDLNWIGVNMNTLAAEFDGDGTVIKQAGVHFYPYGLNYDTEVTDIDSAIGAETVYMRNAAIIYAERQDDGIGTAANPWSATTVTLKQSDAAGTSAFNNWGVWSDNYFTHAGAAYSTGNFTLRTPLDTYNPGNATPSFTFTGDSLTINNTNGSAGGLLFQGKGTTSVLTFKNLILNGGYVRHASGSGDLFQLAGNITLTGSPTIDAAQGNINILSTMGGTGSLTKASAFALSLSGTGSYSGSTTISGGTLRLAPVASIANYTFDNVSGTTVVNSGTGGTAMNGTLMNGATIVSGGQSGNAVSLSGGASVDISNAIDNLGQNNSWTVSAWIKTSTPGGTILSKWTGSSWSAGNSIFYLGDGTSGGSGGIPSSVRWGGGFFQGSTSATSVTNNQWHQVTYVDNAGTYAIYVDGMAQSLSSGNSSFTNMDISSVVRLGATIDNVAGDGTVNFNGLMDNVQLYGQALSASQVNGLYQGSNLYGSLPTSTNVTVASGAALDLNGAVQQIGSLTGAAGSSVKLGSGQLAVNSATNTQFSGAISGSGGSLVKQGGGILTLSGPNSYTGSTTISGGTLQLGSQTGTSVSSVAVANYTFDNVSGSTVINSGLGGTAMNGTLTGGATIVGGGHTGNAVSLSGGAYVNINSQITDLGSAGFWTVSAWVKTSTPGGTILDKSNGGSWTTGNSIFYLGDGAGAGTGGIPSAVRYAGGFFQGSTSAVSVTNNVWHQVTYVDNGGTYGMYVDGVLQALSSGNSSFANADVGSTIRLGVTTDTVAGDGTVNYSGLLDDVQIYSQALSTDQVASLFQGQSLSALPTTTPVSVASGATFDVNGMTQQITSLTGPAGSSVTLGTGQLIVNSATNTIFSGVISGNGGSLVKQGTGTLTLAGANSYTGLTTVSGGTLAVNGSVAGALNVNSSGTLSGIGTVSGLVTVGSGAALTPGNGGQPGSLTVGALSLQNGSQTNVVLAGTTQGTGYSAILSAGAISLGGTLSVTEGSGFSPSPSAITSFDIFGGRTLSGTFSSINLPSLPVPMGWNLLQLYTAGIITATPFIPGDFSRDGHVDASDLIVMMQALADTPDYEASHGNLTDAQLSLIGDINDDSTFNNGDVQALINFLQSGGGSTSAVPEPSALVLLAMGAIGCLLLQRWRAKRASV